jgi:hypothetical protein
MGHTTAKMLYERSAAYIRYRTRHDGAAYLEQGRRSRDEARRKSRSSTVIEIPKGLHRLV